MISLSSITDLHRRTVVRIELPLGGPLTKSIVASINSACDSVEDAGSDAIFVVHLKPAAEAPGADTPVNVTLVNTWERALRRMERIEATTIAIVDGDCGGLATALLLTTDYRIAAHDLRLSMVGADGRIMPDTGLYRLANQLGAATSRRLALFGGALTAEQAQAAGLIDELSADADASVDSFVQSLPPQHAADLFIRRRLLLDAPWQSYDECLGSHLAACDRFLRKQSVAADQTRAGSE